MGVASSRVFLLPLIEAGPLTLPAELILLDAALPFHIAASGREWLSTPPVPVTAGEVGLPMGSGTLTVSALKGSSSSSCNSSNSANPDEDDLLIPRPVEPTGPLLETIEAGFFLPKPPNPTKFIKTLALFSSFDAGWGFLSFSLNFCK